ncbi:Zinc finger CCCH domain-containing protein [Apiospora hydei]|uniref:Zinc finger CCCH domain-containing protein n=1 Tax=Apiospora hydei TaxID=1337664 RepID=A0ABR1X3S6_9PEZI
MSTAEEQELMAQISSLAGRINRHKAQQTGHSGHPNRESSVTQERRRHDANSIQQDATHPTRGAFRVAPYPHGNYRGGRGGRAPAYRNKTLVLNGQARPVATSDDSTPTPTTPNGSSWVTKTDRHLQLINTNVFEKESQNRANAIEQTQRNKQLQKNHVEKARLMNYLGKESMTSVTPTSNTAATPSSYEVTVDGIRFHVTRQGSKLVRATGDQNPPSATPRVTTIGGVKFFRTKNGNLIRHGVAKAQRLACGVKKVDELCKTFSWTGCAVVAICRDWLLKGQCQKGDACDLSHDIAEERVPLCMHFANGNCRNEKCSYLHVEHSQTDLVCRAFGFCGWCDKGASCAERHVFECPDFSNTGAGNKDNAAQEGEISDLSSDDDDDGASNDLDSDEVEEFIGKDDEVQDLDFAAQKDFIGFA